MLLSGVFTYCILSENRQMLTFTTLFVAICATDLLDGFLARKLSACSRAGAVLDVAADLVFILTAVIALTAACMFPIWMIAVIILKFGEFCCTSIQFGKTISKNQRVFLFDPLGKASAISFFLLPYLFILLQYFLPFAFSMRVFTMVCVAAALAALISSVKRIRFLYQMRPVV